MRSNKETVTFCIHNGESFICEVHGKFAIGTLGDIEDQFKEEPLDFDYNVITVTYECCWEPPQYGDEGRVELSGYWDLTEVSRIIVE